jgi:hypothetical protein
MMLSEIMRIAQGAVRAGFESGGIAQRTTVNPQNLRWCFENPDLRQQKLVFCIDRNI